METSKIDKIYSRIFYIVTIGALVLLMVCAAYTHYEALEYYLWKKGSSYYDFFISLRDNIYYNMHSSSGQIYPPLARLFYAVLTVFLTPKTLGILENWTSVKSVFARPDACLMFVLYNVLLVAAFYDIVLHWKKGSQLEKRVFAVIMLLTVPFLYQFERSNVIFIALIFTMLFFLCKDSEKKWVRVVAYICLAIAAAIKIYPAIFGFIVLKDRGFKQTMKLVALGLVACFVPFVFFIGLKSGVTELVSNIFSAVSGVSSNRIGCQIGYNLILRQMFAGLGRTGSYIALVAYWLLAIGSLIAVWKLKNNWKTSLLLTCLLIGIPPISYVYTGIFLVIPLIQYLDEKEKSKLDIIYLIGMTVAMIPLPFAWLEAGGDDYYTYTHVTINTMTEGVAIVLMTLALIVEGIIPLYKKKMSGIISSVAIVAGIVVSLLVNVGQLSAPYAYTEYLTKYVKDKVHLTSEDTIDQPFQAELTGLSSVRFYVDVAEEGILNVSLVDPEDGSVLTTVGADMTMMQTGFNEFSFDDYELVPGKLYYIRFTTTTLSEVRISETGKDKTGELEYHFIKNGEEKSRALGVQVYEE